MLAVLLPVGLYFSVNAAVAWKLLSPIRQSHPVAEGLTEVALPSGGEHTLWAIATPNLAQPSAKVKRVVIFAHGLNGHATQFGDLQLELKKSGVESLSLHMRGHGKSELRTIGMGVKEADEILAAVSWVRKNTAPQTQVVVVGISMGGAATWMAAERQPNAIDGILTEGSFAKMSDTLPSYLDNMMPEGDKVLLPAIWIARAFGAPAPEAVDAASAARAFAGRPSLVVHCGKDDTVSRAESEALAQAARCDLWEIKEAKHAEGFKAKPEAYEARIIGLFKQSQLTHQVAQESANLD